MKLNRRMFLATTASAAVLTALAACAKNGPRSPGSTPPPPLGFDNRQGKLS